MRFFSVQATALACLLGASSFAVVGCKRASLDATPEGAVRTWLEHMEDADDDPRAAREAVGMLGPAATANLTERARRAALFTGRRFDAIDMVAPGRFGMRFRPKHMKTSVVGEHAVVEVTGDDPARDRAEVRCVLVQGSNGAVWRIEPELPELPQTQHAEPDTR